MLKIYNTRTRQVEEFKPQNGNDVKMYCCGPTVYDYTHIGHLRKYYFDQVLAKTLKLAGYNVKHVINVTDVGHLTDDGDAGDDKLEKGAAKTGKTVWEVAKYFEEYFFLALSELGIAKPQIVCRATEHIPQMIAMNKTLVEKGYAYETAEALYFDISKFTSYGKLSGQSLNSKIVGVRSEVVEDVSKRNSADFALWFKTVGKFANHSMHWPSPWGEGFPGWHIECSAMSTHYLGARLDIHTGGIDHIPVHHENEIAQSEAATGESPFVKYWVHHNHLFINGQKMSKSLGNFLRLEDIKEKGFTADDLKFLFLQSSYRSEQNFTFEALQGAHNALKNLKNKIGSLGTNICEDRSDNKFISQFKQHLFNDLNTARAVAYIFESIESDSVASELPGLLQVFTEIFGINLDSSQNINIPSQILDLAKRRQEAKQNKDFALADSLRREIEEVGYNIKDLAGNTFKIEGK